MPGDSLRGQNKGRRVAGVGSSPALPTRSERTRLWQRLRRLDRQIAGLDQWLYLNSWFRGWTTEQERGKKTERRAALDAKRRDARNRLKGYQV